MVILDADSVDERAAPDYLVVRPTDKQDFPDADVSLPPRAQRAGRRSLFARIQQFANGVYGPIFVAGLHYFELGAVDHRVYNAIIRVAPFIEHRALRACPENLFGELPGRTTSCSSCAHAARRLGRVDRVICPLEPHQEMPPNLIDELNRDRRGGVPGHQFA